MGSKAVEIPAWVDRKNPDEMKAFRAGVKAGRAGEEMPRGVPYYVVMYAGWVAGNAQRPGKAKKP